MPAQIKLINDNECIGDSLEQINKNFAALKVLIDEFKFTDTTTLENIRNGLNTIKNSLNQLPD